MSAASPELSARDPSAGRMGCLVQLKEVKFEYPLAPETVLTGSLQYLRWGDEQWGRGEQPSHLTGDRCAPGVTKERRH